MMHIDNERPQAMAPKNKRTKEEPAARAVWASREYGMDKKEELQSSL